MRKRKFQGYDVGGGEWPAGPNLIVIDALAMEHARRFWCPETRRCPPQYYRRNIGDADWTRALTPKPYVNVSRVLRYLPMTYTDTPTFCTILDPESLHRCAEQVAGLVSPGGVIRVYDYGHVVTEFVRWFGDRPGWCVQLPCNATPAEDGMPMQWEQLVIRTPDAY